MLNSKQKVVLYIAVGLIAILCLFPTWSYKSSYTGKIIMEIGIRPIFAPPPTMKQGEHVVLFPIANYQLVAILSLLIAGLASIILLSSDIIPIICRVISRRREEKKIKRKINWKPNFKQRLVFYIMVGLIAVSFCFPSWTYKKVICSENGGLLEDYLKAVESSGQDANKPRSKSTAFDPAEFDPASPKYHSPIDIDAKPTGVDVSKYAIDPSDTILSKEDSAIMNIGIVYVFNPPQVIDRKGYTLVPVPDYSWAFVRFIIITIGGTELILSLRKKKEV